MRNRALHCTGTLLFFFVFSTKSEAFAWISGWVDPSPNTQAYAEQEVTQAAVMYLETTNLEGQAAKYFALSSAPELHSTPTICTYWVVVFSTRHILDPNNASRVQALRIWANSSAKLPVWKIMKFVEAAQNN